VAQHARKLFPLRRDARTPGPVSARAPTEKRLTKTLWLAIEVRETQDGVVVQLRGDAGIAEAGTLDASLGRLLARRPAWVTFDLSELRSVSTLAMGALASFRRAAVRVGTRVGLAPDLQPVVREALTRAGLISLFEAVGTRSSAAGPGCFGGGAPQLYPALEEVQRTYGVTWNQLVDLEPRLATLLWRTRMAVAKCSTLTDTLRVFGPVRDELAGLIGFAGKHHRHPILGSAAAYAVAYWKLYDAVAHLLPRRAAGEK
jgi:anti-anti-sigma regulatory factor